MTAASVPATAADVDSMIISMPSGMGAVVIQAILMLIPGMGEGVTLVICSMTHGAGMAAVQMIGLTIEADVVAVSSRAKARITDGADIDRLAHPAMPAWEMRPVQVIPS